MNKLWLVLILGIGSALAQGAPLTPSEIEIAKLGKLKAELDSIRAQLQALDAQRQAIDLAKQLTQEHGQQKYSEYLGYGESVKQAHVKDWGSADQIQFDPSKGEVGVFTLTKKEASQPEKPKEEKKDAIKKDAKKENEEGQKVKK